MHLSKVEEMGLEHILMSLKPLATPLSLTLGPPPGQKKEEEEKKKHKMPEGYQETI